MRLVDIINISFLVACGICFLSLILCGLAWRRKRTQRVKLFGCVALFFFLIALPLIYFSLREGNRQFYEIAVDWVRASSAQQAYSHFAKAGDYRDAQEAAKLLKAILEPGSDFPALVRKVREYPDKETLPQEKLIRFMLDKVSREKKPAEALMLLSAWPMDLTTANKFAGDDFGWKFSVQDPDVKWLREAADPTSKKVVVYSTNNFTTSGNIGVVCFGFMDLLPTEYLPGPADTVGKVILLTHRSTIVDKYAGGGAAPHAGVLSIDVTICSLPDMRVLKHIGKASGGRPPQTTKERGISTKEGWVVHGDPTP